MQGAMVWTTVQAQAAAAVHYFVERQLQGPTVQDFGDDAKQWTVAADSEQWFWQREGKIVERLACAAKLSRASCQPGGVN